MTFAWPVPTLTVPVSTSKAGVCPPVAVTPLLFTETLGASAGRVWLTFISPVATSTIKATTASINMRRIARIPCSNLE